MILFPIKKGKKKISKQFLLKTQDPPRFSFLKILLIIYFNYNTSSTVCSLHMTEKNILNQI